MPVVNKREAKIEALRRTEWLLRFTVQDRIGDLWPPPHPDDDPADLDRYAAACETLALELRRRRFRLEHP